MKPETAFGQVLRSKRRDRGLSQEQLALRSGLDRTFVSLLERGLRQPSLTSILLLSKTLGISAADMVQETADLTIGQ
ncbi:helix-turn-helix transcriptional regulator [Halioglobus sp. HI00S01]|uniref:helix-turn-helix domain-containing protein n=1 Tax=Halioglobus sp. HI00S01 TaxID=1822214 RepID=UPI0009EE3CD5